MVEEYSDEEREEILDKVYEWGAEFSKSRYFERLTEEQKQESEFLLTSFAEYMYSYEGLTPEEWDEGGLEECCLYTLPRKISAEESYFRAIAPVLSAFFSFLGEKELLKSESAANLARRVKEIDKQIIKNAADPRNWGPAKSFVMAAMRAGVDVMNQKEMDQFMVLYNLALREGVDVTNEREMTKFMAERPASLDDLENESAKKPEHKRKKVGRNDPCPCGSGKKYKKCCGRYE